MRRILLSQKHIDEILNPDLSFSTDNNPQGSNKDEVSASAGFSTVGSQPTTDTVARQSGQYQPNYFGAYALRGLTMNEDEQLPNTTDQKIDIGILDTYNQKGLQQSVISLANSIKNTPQDSQGEITAVILSYFLTNLNLSLVQDDKKNMLRNLIR